MPENTRREPVVIDRFEYRGFHGNRSVCKLEVLPLDDGRTVVIATELPDNPGTSVTNVAEHLASMVCDQFGIDPDRLVWIEHYGYPSAIQPTDPRQYEQVRFRRRPPETIRWSPPIAQAKPDGRPGYFEAPEWRLLTAKEWERFGLSPREAID